MHDYKKFLQPENISKLSSIDLQAKLIVEGFITGIHQSPYHGFSVEFSEYRQYSPGDEIRHIDWKIFGRTGKYYIKRYEQETNLRAYIFLDSSLSMKYRSDASSLTKIEYSGYLAAALTLLLMRQRDATGLITFDTAIISSLPPRLKYSHQNLVLKTISQAINHSPKKVTDTKQTMSHVISSFARQMTPRSLSIVISDLWEPPELGVPALNLLKYRGNEVIVFHVLDPQEKEFSFKSGKYQFIDLETGGQISTSPQQIKNIYRKAFSEHCQTYKNELLNNRIDYMMLDTSLSFDIGLLNYFKKRKKIR